MKRRVFVLQEILPNYRIPIFQKIAALQNIDFTLVCCRISTKQKKDAFVENIDDYGFRIVLLPPSSERKGEYLKILFQLIQKERPHVVITGMWMSSLRLLALLKALYQFRLIPWIGGTLLFSDEDIREEFERHRRIRGIIPVNLIGLFYRWCDGFIVYSEHASWYLQHFYHIDKRKIHIVYNSPDTDVYFAARELYSKSPDLTIDLREKYSPQGEKIILSLGRLNEGRDIPSILKAFQIVQRCDQDVSLVIIGEGPEKDNLMKMATGMELQKVHFVGALYDDWEIARYFHVAHAYTGIGSLAVKISMAMAKPVVGIRYGLDAHDIDDGIDGYLVDRGDITSLAKRISKLLEHGEKACEMGKNGHEKMKNKINIQTMAAGFRKAVFME